jgi:hypothetical protein
LTKASWVWARSLSPLSQVIEDVTELAPQHFDQTLCDFFVIDIADMGDVGGDAVERPRNGPVRTRS